MVGTATLTGYVADYLSRKGSTLRRPRRHAALRPVLRRSARDQGQDDAGAHPAGLRALPGAAAACRECRRTSARPG